MLFFSNIDSSQPIDSKPGRYRQNGKGRRSGATLPPFSLKIVVMTKRSLFPKSFFQTPCRPQDREGAFLLLPELLLL
jgi:hypothetical protein